MVGGTGLMGADAVQSVQERLAHPGVSEYVAWLRVRDPRSHSSGFEGWRPQVQVVSDKNHVSAKHCT